MKAELDANFLSFENRWKDQWNAAEANFSPDDQFRKAYYRLVSMQAWRSEMLEGSVPEEAGQFFLEGQNDLLVAYIAARVGQWRAALQAQRASIESYLNGLYFKDHPVELLLWSQKKFKTHFTENLKYFESHPSLNNLHKRFTGLKIIKDEYATLSLAVHGSAKAFRMTRDNGPKYFSVDEISKNQWITRNRMLIRGLNLLLLGLYKDEMVGTRKRNLRKSISLSLQAKDKSWVKEVHGVTIPFDVG